MKKRLLCPTLPRKGTPVYLSETEAHHATRVLRLREGDSIEAIDGKGGFVHAILRVKGGPTRLEFQDSPDSTIVNQQKDAVLPVILEMSILKGEAMEWVVEKAVELGVQKIVPLMTDYTVVQIQSKGPKAFQERWQKIADQSLKQCGRLDRLEIDLPLSLQEHLSKTAQSKEWTRLWCDEASLNQAPFLSSWLLENHKSKLGSTWRILLGPEGGWSEKERELLTQEGLNQPTFRIQLGPLILRAETAALFTTSVVGAHVRSQLKSSLN